MTMLKSIRNKSTVAINKLAPGESMLISVDKNDTPLDYDWRRAVKNAEIDDGVELSKTGIDGQIGVVPDKDVVVKNKNASISKDKGGK